MQRDNDVKMQKTNRTELQGVPKMTQLIFVLHGSALT